MVDNYLEVMVGAITGAMNYHTVTHFYDGSLDGHVTANATSSSPLESWVTVVGEGTV